MNLALSLYKTQENYAKNANYNIDKKNFTIVKSQIQAHNKIIIA